MTSWFIWHSIALAALLLDATEDLGAKLDERTRATLTAIGPYGGRADGCICAVCSTLPKVQPALRRDLSSPFFTYRRFFTYIVATVSQFLDTSDLRHRQSVSFRANKTERRRSYLI